MSKKNQKVIVYFTQSINISPIRGLTNTGDRCVKDVSIDWKQGYVELLILLGKEEKIIQVPISNVKSVEIVGEQEPVQIQASIPG